VTREEEIMNPRPRTARSAGLLYLLSGLPAVFTLQVIPALFFVRGNATATTEKILAREGLYRLGLVAEVVSAIGFVVLGLALYDLFKDVDRPQARLLVTTVAIAAAFGLIATVLRFVPLVMLTDADFLAPFSRPQLEALSLAALRLHGRATDVVTSLWGVWLLPFGVLVMRSRFIPRLLGVLLIVAGVALCALCVVALAAPAYKGIFGTVAWTLDGLGELPIMAWLLVRGGRVPWPRQQPALATA
jgi:hypothetical protein